MDQTTIDNMTAQRMVHYLVTPYSQWDAARLGIIDNEGKLKREPKNSNETMYFNMFHMLVIKLKDLLKTSGRGTNWILPSTAGSFYLGNKNLPAANFTNWTIANRSSLPIMGAAYSSMKECINKNDIGLFESSMMHFLDNMCEEDYVVVEALLEDGTTMTTGANVVLGNPDTIVPSTTYKKKNEKKTAEILTALKPLMMKR